jgi:hypothetical protein
MLWREIIAYAYETLRKELSCGGSSEGLEKVVRIEKQLKLGVAVKVRKVIPFVGRNHYECLGKAKNT